MAVAPAPGALLGPHDEGELSVCPMCGQPLLDHDAIERVEHAQEEFERRIQEAVQAQAEQLAKHLSRREQKAAAQKIDQLAGELSAQREVLARQKRDHEAEVRKLRTSIRAELATEAEKAARTKVQRDLHQRDILIKRLKEENDVQQRRIEHLTADERGEFNEEEIVARLQAAFPDDRIERQGRGRAGADILHEVRYSLGEKMTAAGQIVYECKDTLQWNNRFVEQAAKERNRHGTPHVVIISRAFPANEEELCVRDGTPIVAPGLVVELARVLREMVIQLCRAGLAQDDQSRKTTELYAYIAGDEFRQAFATLTDSTVKLTQLLNKERSAHELTWAKRQQAYSELGATAAAVDGRVRAIIERSAEQDA